MELTDKLEILADAAKYDASCASSGAPRRSSDSKDGIGATSGMGICHSHTPDGRCVSLLKMKKIAPLIVTADYSPVGGAASSESLRRSLAVAPQQMNLWTELQAA